VVASLAVAAAAVVEEGGEEEEVSVDAEDEDAVGMEAPWARWAAAGASKAT
jgi:hypothetical protein